MAFNKTNLYLANMNLLDRLAGYTLTNLIQEQITNHVQETCNGIFEMSHIKNLEKVVKSTWHRNTLYLNFFFFSGWNQLS